MSSRAINQVVDLQMRAKRGYGLNLSVRCLLNFSIPVDRIGLLFVWISHTWSVMHGVDWTYQWGVINKLASAIVGWFSHTLHHMSWSECHRQAGAVSNNAELGRLAHWSRMASNAPLNLDRTVRSHTVQTSKLLQLPFRHPPFSKSEGNWRKEPKHKNEMFIVVKCRFSHHYLLGRSQCSNWMTFALRLLARFGNGNTDIKIDSLLKLIKKACD